MPPTTTFQNSDGTKSTIKEHDWKKNIYIETTHQGRKKIKETEYSKFSIENEDYYVKRNETLYFDGGFKFKRWDSLNNRKFYIQIEHTNNKTRKEITFRDLNWDLNITITDLKTDCEKVFYFKHNEQKTTNVEDYKIIEIFNGHETSNLEQESKKSNLNDQIDTDKLSKEAWIELKNAMKELKYEPYVFKNLEKETISWLDSKKYPEQAEFEKELSKYSILGGMTINGIKHPWETNTEQKNESDKVESKQEEPLTL